MLFFTFISMTVVGQESLHVVVKVLTDTKIIADMLQTQENEQTGRVFLAA